MKKPIGMLEDYMKQHTRYHRNIDIHRINNMLVTAGYITYYFRMNAIGSNIISEDSCTGLLVLIRGRTKCTFHKH